MICIIINFIFCLIIYFIIYFAFTFSVTGYCMDYNEVYRDLNHIAVIGSIGIEKYKNGPAN